MASESDQAAIIDITVKTLDGQNKTFNVPENISVQQFKDRISTSINIPAENQRLIFQGRVMQDEKILKDYDIHGKAIHLVQRAPPTSLSGTSSTASTTTASSAGRQRAPLDGSLFDVQIHLGRVQSAPNTREARARIRQADFNLRLVNDVLNQFEERLRSIRGEQINQNAASSSGPVIDSADTAGTNSQSEDTATVATNRQSENVVTATVNRQSGDTMPTATNSQSEDRMDTSPLHGECRTGQAGERDPPRQQPQNSSGSTGGSTADQPVGLMATELANFLDQVLSTNNRVTSHIRLYCDLLRNEVAYPAMSQEAQDAQDVVSRATEVFHALGHMLHSLSDVVVDMGTNMPRQAVAASPLPFSIPGTASMAIPIHMNVRSRQNGNEQRQGRQTATATTTNSLTSTTPAASTAAPSQISNDSSTATVTGGATTSTTSSSTTAQNPGPGLGPFQMPPVSLNLSPVVPTPGDSAVMVEVFPAGVTVHDIHAVVTHGDIEDDSDSSNDSADVAGNRTNITITSATSIGHPFELPPMPTAPATNMTSPPSTDVTHQTDTPRTSDASVSTSSPTSSTFTFGSVPSVNIGGGGVPGFGIGQMLNVPGLPPGLLQSILGSILNSPGVNPDQALQINVIQQMAPGVTPATQPPQQSQTQQEPSRSNRSAPQNVSPFIYSPWRPRPRLEISTQSPPSMHLPAGARPQATATTTGNNTSGWNTFTSTFNLPNLNTQSTSSTGTRTSPITSTSSTSTNPPRTHFHIHQNPPGRGWTRGQSPLDRGRGRGLFHTRPQVPGPLWLGQTTRGYVDPYLPCSSPHYMSPTAVAAFQAMQVQPQPRGSNQQVPNLSTMVSGMVGEIIQQAGQAVAASGTRTSSSTTPSTATSAPSGTISQPPPALNPLEMFSHLLEDTGASGQAVSGDIDFGAMINNVMQALGGPYASTASSSPYTSTISSSGTVRGSAGPPTLADLFTQLRHAGAEQDVNIILSLLEAVAPHMGLVDLFSLVMGNTSVLNHVRGPLQDFVRAQVTQHGSVDSLVEIILNDAYSEIQHLQTLVRVVDGVDLAQSLRSCLRIHLTAIFTALNTNNSGPQGDFGSHLYSLWMKLLADSIGLCVHCIQDGQTGFSNMVQNYMPRMTQGLNPSITMWMSTSVQDILASFYHNHPVAEADIQRYIVNQSERPTAIPTVTQNPSASTPVTESQDIRQTLVASLDSGDSSLGSSPPQQMDTSDSPSSRPPKAKLPRTMPDENADEQDIFEDAQESLTSRPPSRALPNTIAIRPGPVAGTMSGSRDGRNSNDWQSVIPQNWIPVISRDLVKQQNQRPQPPLSDAYVQGLPAKRRRMMSLEHAGELGNMPLYLPASLARAAQAVAAEPISSEENMAQEAADDLDLQAELWREMKEVLRSRITSDQDFNSERFPNAQQYFQKSNFH